MQRRASCRCSVLGRAQVFLQPLEEVDGDGIARVAVRVHVRRRRNRNLGKAYAQDYRYSPCIALQCTRCAR
eukprot:scaffold5219_cov289-Prasinococcus_capsulatus_cf.AAC.2